MKKVIAPLSNEAKKGQEIVNLAKREFTPYQKQAVDLFKAQPETKQVIKDALNIDVGGFTHQVDKYALKHSLDGHIKDILPMTTDDFRFIPDILKNPDNVKYSGKTATGRDAVQYQKRYNGTTYYVEEIRTGKQNLNMTTMYKEPSGASTAQGLTPTSISKEITTPNGSTTANLPPNEPFVNGQAPQSTQGANRKMPQKKGEND